MREQSFYRWFGVWLGFLLFLTTGIPFIAVAQDISGLVKPQPEVFEVGMGQVERLAIVLENAKDIYGVDIRAKFDPNMVEIADADENKDGIQMIPGNFPKPDFLVRNQADNEAGTLMYVITQVNPSPPANGDGIIFWVEIRGKVMGETPFTLELVDAADREGKTLILDKKDGIIRVVKPKPPTPTVTATRGPTDTPGPESISQEQPVSAQATETVIVPIETPQTESKGAGITTNQILVGVAGGSFVGAALLFGYVFWAQRRR